MALPNSGAISFQDINNELGMPSNATVSTHSRMVRSMVGCGYTNPSGNSCAVPWWIANRNQNAHNATTGNNNTHWTYNNTNSSSNLANSIYSGSNNAWSNNPRSSWYDQGGYNGLGRHARSRIYPYEQLGMGDLRASSGINGTGSATTAYVDRVSPVWRTPNVLENFTGSQAGHGNAGDSDYDLKCGAVFDAIQCSLTGNNGAPVSSGTSQNLWDCNQLLDSNEDSLLCAEDNGSLYGSNYYYRGCQRGLWSSQSSYSNPTLTSYTRPQGQGGTSWALLCRSNQNLRLQYQKHGISFQLHSGFYKTSYGGDNDSLSLPFYNTTSSTGTADANGTSRNRMSSQMTTTNNSQNQHGWTVAMAYKLDSNRGTAMNNTSNPWTRNWIIWGSGYYEWANLSGFAKADGNYSTTYIGSMRGSSNYGTRGYLSDFPSGYSGYASLDHVWIVDVVRVKGDQWTGSAFNSSNYNGGSMTCSSFQIMKKGSTANTNIITSTSPYYWGNNGSTASRISHNTSSSTGSQFYWGPNILPSYWNYFTTSNQCYHLFHWSFYCTPFSDTQMEHLAKNLWYHYVGGSP